MTGEPTRQPAPFVRLDPRRLTLPEVGEPVFVVEEVGEALGEILG